MNKIMKIILILLVIYLIIGVMFGFLISKSSGKPLNIINIITWGYYAPHFFKTFIEEWRVLSATP